MPAQRTRLALALLALGAALHLYQLSEPRRVVFDEVHFGGFVTNYLGDHKYFYDIHPPHAKLLIAGVAALGGYRGSQPFENLDQPIEHVSPALLRFVPALSGILLPLVLYGLLLQLGATPLAAFLAGLAGALDNALMLQTRVIALDGILLLATFGSLSAVLAALSAASRLRASALALLAGGLAGLAAGTKFTGLAALPVVGACLLATLLPRPSWFRLRRMLSLSIWVTTGVVIVYSAGWLIHFALLTEPGLGYVWAVPTGDFLFDTVRIHRLMFAGNYGLTAPHPYASAWWSWPLMLRPVFYWNHADAALYFVGNPVLWWGTTLGLLLLLGNGVLLRITELRLAAGESPWPRLLWIPLLGYAIALLPLVRVPRALFLYHYLTALLFALCAVVLWLDHVGWTRTGGWRRQRVSYFVAIGALVLGFVAISPFTFAFVEAPAYREFVFGLFPGLAVNERVGRGVGWIGMGFLLVLGAIAYYGLVFWDPRSHGFSGLVGWFFESSDSSPQLIFAIVAVLLFRRRAELRAAAGGPAAPALAALCLFPAAAIHVWAQWVDAPDLTVVSLALVLLGTGFALGGRPLARVLATPLALLVFAIPIPGALHNFVVYPYQLTTAGAAEAVLRAAGFDVLLQGDVITFDGRPFEVIETCSGLRSAQTLLLLAAAWAAWFRCSWQHTLCLLAVSPAIAFLTNGIRVLILILDPRPEVQESHATQGFVMFIVGIVALAAVDRALLRLEPSEVEAGPEAPAARASGVRWRLAPVGLVLALMALATLALPALRPAAPELPPPPELPRELAGWTVKDGPEPGQFLGNVRFTHRSNLTYERGEESVSAFLGFDDRQLRIRSLLSDKNAVPGVGWEVEERGHSTPAPGLGPMERVVARRFASRSLALHAYRGTGGVLEETLRAALALDQPGSPLARRERTRVLRVSTPIGPGPDGLRDADERLRLLLTELAPALEG